MIDRGSVAVALRCVAFLSAWAGRKMRRRSSIIIVHRSSSPKILQSRYWRGRSEPCSLILSLWLGGLSRLWPAYVAWRAGTTTICQSRLYPPSQELRIWPQISRNLQYKVKSVKRRWILASQSRHRTNYWPSRVCEMVLCGCRSSLDNQSCHVKGFGRGGGKFLHVFSHIVW